MLESFRGTGKILLLQNRENHSFAEGKNSYCSGKEELILFLKIGYLTFGEETQNYFIHTFAKEGNSIFG